MRCFFFFFEKKDEIREIRVQFSFYHFTKYLQSQLVMRSAHCKGKEDYALIFIDVGKQL